MKYLFLLLALWGILLSCQRDEDLPEDSELSLEQQMNEFIDLKMKDIYLWADDVNDRNIDTDQDPSDFLAAMMYKEKDSWSRLEISEGSTKANVDGNEMTFGYKIKFWEIGVGKIVGVIQYVYPKSPAAIAGVKRGDIVIMNNGERLNEKNYLKVIQDSKVSLRMGTIFNDIISYDEEKIYELSAQQMALNPILLDTILEVGNKKVGYFVYSQFIDNETNSLSDISEAIGKMKTESIDEFILDLRSNTGGRASAARRLASLLAPANAVSSSEVLIYTQWNEKYQERYGNTNASDNLFDPSTLSDNLDLSKIYILTGEWTASASELVISGLRPYIADMILIGEKTYGKYVGASQILPKKELQKWTLWPITFSYTNSVGEDVRGGMEATVFLEEDIFNLAAFGSSEDILFTKAIQLINGQSSLASSQSRRERSTTSWKLLEGDTKYLLID